MWKPCGLIKAELEPLWDASALGVTLPRALKGNKAAYNVVPHVFCATQQNRGEVKAGNRRMECVCMGGGVRELRVGYVVKFYTM